MIRNIILHSALILALPTSVIAQAEKGRTFAFLVACGDYDKTQFKQVSFTVPEMQAFRQVLIDSGVSDKNIVFLYDKADEPRRFLPTRANILDQFKLLMERLRPEDSVIVALSGHGVQFKADKFGYFCPLDAKIGADTKSTLLPMEGDDGLLRLLDQSKAGRKFLIVNACRNNPTSGLNLAAEKLQFRDEYNEEAPKGTVMLLACKQNQFSWFYDDKEKRAERRNRSLFMYHLTEAWKGSYAKGKKVTIDHIVAEVTDRVEEDAPADFGKNQIPIVKRKFEGQWEFGSPITAVAKQIDVDLGSGVKLALMHIPPGKFLMGSPKEEKNRSDYEFQHEVEITKCFYMGKYEVTQEEYEAIMGKNPSSFKGVRLPVEKVSWEDAKDFCRKASAKTGKTIRLPSEAEWEYACRAGTKTPFHFGETISTDQANYDGNFVYGNGQKGGNRAKTMPVGSFAANAFGLYDMHGNVREWCEDWYDGTYYDRSPNSNPLNETAATTRVSRGGSWGGIPSLCRSASRTGFAPGNRNVNFGFRVVLPSP